MVPSHAAVLDLDATIPLPMFRVAAIGLNRLRVIQVNRPYLSQRAISDTAAFSRMNPCSAALVVLRSVAFHRRDLWIVKLLRSTSEGVSSVLKNLTKSLDLLLEKR
jgi:hypothetical protein